MQSPIWRICNIYTIRDRHGKPIPFRPTNQQKRVLRAIYIEHKKKLFIPKARQLGMSTLISIIILDSILFGSGVQTCINDHVKGAAKKKLVSKILYAFDRLPEEWRAGWEVVNRGNQTGELRIRKAGGTTEHDSTVYAGDKARGDTFQILHLSELGETQAKAPERAKEIIEGSMPAAESGLIVIETTWHGGKVGQLYGLVLDAIETPDDKKDLDRDFFILFFPWFEEPSYTSNGDVAQVTQATRDYFTKLASKLSLEFTDGQMLWYQKKKEAFGHRIYSIYPSILEEIFLSPVDGAIYAKEIDEARVHGRCGAIAHDPQHPVNTLWDFGSPKNTICIYFQIIAGRFHFIDADVVEERDGQSVEINGLDLSFEQRIAHMSRKPYLYSTHYVPHDATSRDIRHRVSWQDDMRHLGLKGNVTVIPRTNDIWLGINRVRADFGLFHFSDAMKPYLDGLAMYRLRPDPSNEKKFTSDPIHDFASHLADPLRVLGEALILGYTSTTSVMNTNTVIDPILLQGNTALAEKPEVGEIEKGVRSRAFKAAPDGWMWRWEPVSQAGGYLVVIHRGIVQAWRAPNGNKAAALVATLADIGRSDNDMVVHLGCEIAHYYHNCIVIPTINDDESIVRRVLDEECMIYQRRVPDSQRPVGRALPPRKPGYDLTEQLRASTMTGLVKAYRDKSIVIHDTTWLSQASTFILLDDGQREPQSGYSAAALEASAIAVSLLEIATEGDHGGTRGLTRMS